MTNRILLLVILAAALLLGPAPAAHGTEPASPPAEPEQPAADAGAAAEPAPIVVQDPLYRIEFQLPAPYWDYADREQLAARPQGGCAAPRTPQDLLFVLSHKDASALGRFELGPQSFLMRNKDDLETFVAAFTEAIRSQVGDLEEKTESYPRTENPIVHRLEFTAAARGAGGCSMQRQPAGEQPKMRYTLVHYFVRPKGADAMVFKIFCAAPAEVFEELRPEFDFIIASLRYTGDVEAEFFAPDAPEDKVLSAKDAARSAGAARKTNWLLPVAMILIVWMMLRRRKKAPTA